MPWDTSTVKFSCEAFFCFYTVLEMELLRIWHLSLSIPQELLHCQSIWSCFDNFAATEHHQYNLEPVVLLNESPVMSSLLGVVLIALGDSRGYRYRRPALLLGLFCFVIGFIFFTITCPHCSQISGHLKGALLQILHSFYVQTKTIRWRHSFISS